MKITDEMIERAAKALYTDSYRDWRGLGEAFKEAYRRQARIALRAALKSTKRILGRQ
jgi:hypothetical protein